MPSLVHQRRSPFWNYIERKLTNSLLGHVLCQNSVMYLSQPSDVKCPSVALPSIHNNTSVPIPQGPRLLSWKKVKPEEPHIKNGLSIKYFAGPEIFHCLKAVSAHEHVRSYGRNCEAARRGSSARLRPRGGTSRGSTAAQPCSAAVEVS